ALAAPSPAPAADSVFAAPASDEITDDDFEALLDKLHGKGSFDSAIAAPVAAPPAAVADKAPSQAAASDEITNKEIQYLQEE
ncbi:chemotaxis protein CheA, partial [Pseudomonas syringae pv. tagetis]